MMLMQGCALPWPPENCIEMWKAEKAQVPTHNNIEYNDDDNNKQEDERQRQEKEGGGLDKRRQTVACKSSSSS